MKRKIMKTGMALMAVLGVGCTANYLDINTNPYEVSKDQMNVDGYAVGAAMKALCSAVISTDVNTAQLTDCLLGGPMGGYYATSNSGFAYTIDNYNPTDDWTRVLMASDRVIPVLFSNMLEIKSITDNPITLAITEVIKVCALSRVTDTYGPIPYSKIGEDGKIQTPYDSQETVYKTMFDELDHAIAVLTENKAGAISSTADPLYGGSAEKWCKLANSMKLRLAMRIVYTDFVSSEGKTPRQLAEEAVNHEVGVMTSNADNAKLPSTAFGEKGNPLAVAVKYNQVTHADKTACATGGDSHAAADIICYMNGYNDPRLEKYFVKSEWEGVDYVGMRRGIEIPALGSIGHKYSGIDIKSNAPVYWMNAAEVAFLKAEAKAVFGFDMGGEAETFYNEGIRLSFEQNDVTGYAAYVADAIGKPETYSDPSGANSYSSVLSELSVKWDETATPAQKQERIIIQKWIANFNLGHEAWADYRRTGYPHLIPATAAGNKSGGVVDSNLGARRMPYPQVEYTNNSQNIQEAVSSYLKGPDNMATRIWWDCNPSIK